MTTLDSNRTLTDADIDALVAAFGNRHECRFPDIEPEVMREAVHFYRNWNKVLDDSKGVVGKTILVLLVTGLVTVMGWGMITIIKFKAAAGFD